MFSFFRKKSAGKSDPVPKEDEHSRNLTNRENTRDAPVTARAPTHNYDATKDRQITPKDVVNLLIPKTDYNQKPTTVGGLIQNIMAGKKKRNKKNKIMRAQSCREISPQKETQQANLQRSNSELDKNYKQCNMTRSADDVSAPTSDKNTLENGKPRSDPADYVKALVLQKYANKSPIEPKKQHVSLVYVSNEPNLDEKRHAESLLREIAKSIDCTIDKLNAEKELMGTTPSKKEGNTRPDQTNDEHFYETIDEKYGPPDAINVLRDGLKDELEKILEQETNENNDETKEEYESTEEQIESPIMKKKSNLKPPRADTDVCSDDGSDCSKKRVTFTKHVFFDDGEEQTDQEMDSSFESLSSEGEEGEEMEEGPDNDETLGGVVVCRNEDKTVDTSIKIIVEEVDDEKPISSDNSDSGFLDISDKNGSNDDYNCDVKTLVESSESEVSESGEEVSESGEEETESESENEVIIEEVIEENSETDGDDDSDGVKITELCETDNYDPKTLVSQETKFQSQVAALTELADSRCEETDKARELINQYRKEIEQKGVEIEHLKNDLASAYKESELVRQRSRSLEEELTAARTCSADLADKLSDRNDDVIRQLKSELEDAVNRIAELESKVLALERDKERLEQEKCIQEQKALEALTAAEASTSKWRLAHESARSQAAARAEIMLADCEWKMRELEKRARDAEKRNCELTASLEQTKTEKSQPSASHVAELQQLRGLVTEQQRSVQSLTLQLQKVETREEALKLEVHRLKELLDKQCRISKEKEDRYFQTIERLEQQHAKALETVKSESAAAAASSRATLERTHAERTRSALAQLRAEAEKDARNADRKLREVTTRFENLKELLATKEAQFERAIAEANSKSDWELLQLRHLLDKTDITYANNMDKANEKFEKEKQNLIDEWSQKVKEIEEEASTAQEEARKILETTRSKLIAEKNDQIHKLKEQHKKEMEEQWERFMADKESCLSRMKLECRQEGEEERVKREKELLEELSELRAEIQSKNTDFDGLAVKAAACGRTLAVTEQELREALSREKELREKRSEDATKLKMAERAAKDQVEHLQRKCACLKKLFDDIRARLSTRERESEQEIRAKDKEICQLKAEVNRLTKLLMGQSVPTPKLGTRTRADGCETANTSEESFESTTLPVCETQPSAPRRKGGTLKTPELARKRPTLPDLPALPPEASGNSMVEEVGRKRAKSVDLPAVQVPVRIRQLQEKTGINLE